jgi:hypothetical protein
MLSYLARQERAKGMKKGSATSSSPAIRVTHPVWVSTPPPAPLAINVDNTIPKLVTADLGGLQQERRRKRTVESGDTVEEIA